MELSKEEILKELNKCRYQVHFIENHILSSNKKPIKLTPFQKIFIQKLNSKYNNEGK